ncbi:MAG TPA: hypothetical protein VK186_27685 [Candidatus Deferrimicrobium sp.]|nr:hypothetical protein [Candidatus Kapabacteria bacterium]HLP62653.1 hypothetical protein [Candidatus Deferrimicrobium sp.]
MKTNDSVLKKYAIMRELSYIPPERLNEVETFIKFILFQSKIGINNRKREPKTLAGIWKNKGFEKIDNLDEEIRKLRQELGNQINR